MTNLVEQIKRDREAGTPGPWFSEADDGPECIFGKAKIGVWSEQKFRDAEALDDPAIEPEDEAWLCGIWGKIGEEEVTNARRIARVPDMEAALLAADEGVSECDEILRNLIEEIQKSGNYSVESTVTFLQGARSELAAYRKATGGDADA